MTKIDFSEVNGAISNDYIDPSLVSSQLMKGIEAQLRQRAHATTQNYWATYIRFHELASAYTVNTKSSLDKQMEAIQVKSDGCSARMESISKQLAITTRSARGYKALQAKAKKQLEEANEVLFKMTRVHGEMGKSLSNFEDMVRELDIVWKQIQGADGMAARLEWWACVARFQSQLVTFVTAALMLSVAILVDRYTPATETFIAPLSRGDEHQLALVLFFTVQAVLLEPVVGKLKRLLGMAVLQRYVGTARDISEKIDTYQASVSAANAMLSRYEKTTL